MNQSSKRTASMLLALGCIAGAIAVFFLFIQPTYGDIQDIRAKLKPTQQLLDDQNKYIAQAKQLLTQYQTESQSQDNLALAMPSGPNVASALAQLYGISKNNNVNVTSLNLSAPVVQVLQAAAPPSSAAGGGTLSDFNRIKKSMGTFSIQVIATGSYESLKAFLAQLESNIRIFDVTQLNIQSGLPSGASAAPGPGGKVQIQNPDLFTYNLSVTTYYQLP